MFGGAVARGYPRSVKVAAQRIVTFPDPAMPHGMRRQVRALEDQAWPPEPGVSSHGHDPHLDPVTMLVVEGKKVLASLAILSKEISHAGRRFNASGLSAVVTERTRRRQGLGLRLVAMAREAIRESGADLGIFTCDEPLAGFYERAGWKVLPGTVLVGGTPRAPLPSDLFGKVAMAGFFTGHGLRHAADFVGTRVELYPGEIDRLW